MQNIKIRIQQALIVIHFAVFILGQLGRLQFGNGIALNILDIIVLMVVFLNLENYKSWFRSPITKPFLLFIAVCVLSLLVNFWRIPQIQLISALLYFLRWIIYTSIIFVVYSFSPQMKIFTQKLLFTTGVCLVVIGFVQYIFYTNLRNLYYLGWDDHMYRLFSTFLDPNFAGAFYVLFSLFVGDVFLRAMKSSNKKKLCIYGMLLLVTFVAVFLTYSRSALIMLLVAWFVLLVLHKKLRFILIIILLLFVYVIAISPRFYVENINLFRTFSTQERLKSAVTAVSIIKDNPLLGVGFNAYRAAQLRYGYRTPKGADVSHADGGTDNSFLFVAATSGIIGLIAYLYFWYVVLRLSFKTNNQLSFVVIASSIGLFIDSLFLNSLFYPQFMLWMGILMGFSITSYKKAVK